MEGLLETSRRGVEEGPGHGPAHVVDHHVEPPELLLGPAGQRGDGLEVAEVGGHRDRPPAGGPDLLGGGLQLVGGAGGHEHVGAGLGQGDGGGRADAPAGPGDDGHLVVQPEAVEDHRDRPRPVPVSARPSTRNRPQAGRVGGSPSLRWSQETVRSTLTLATTRLCSMVSTKGRRSSV